MRTLQLPWLSRLIDRLSSWRPGLEDTWPDRGASGAVNLDVKFQSLRCHAAVFREQAVTAKQPYERTDAG